jgi:hypothetical protein
LRQSGSCGEGKKTVVGVVMVLAVWMSVPTDDIINLIVNAAEFGITV